MALIKKTIVLSNNKTLGYLSVIQVGSETGVKVVGDAFDGNMRAVLRIGKKLYRFPLTGTRTETVIAAEVGSEDDIGCLIATGDSLVAKGGAAPALGEALKEESAPPEPPKAEQTADPADEPQPQEKETSEDQELLDRLQKEREKYYYTVKDKVDELFVVNPSEPLLSSLIPDSEWVKVRYDGEDYYVVGRLYDENKKITFLGYGVPGIESIRPPKVADGIASFLPEKEGSNKGYWLFFQNAENGKIE